MSSFACFSTATICPTEERFFPENFPVNTLSLPNTHLR